MPRGGFRVGAGRKPRGDKGVVIGMDGQRRPSVAASVALGPAPEDAAAHPLVTPPEGLPDGQQPIWRGLAPHAIAQATLVPATVRGFRELCELVLLKQQIADAIVAAGAATSGMDALLRHYTKLSQRLDAVLARYRLTAAGKPESTAAKPKKASPWAKPA